MILVPGLSVRRPGSLGISPPDAAFLEKASQQAELDILHAVQS